MTAVIGGKLRGANAVGFTIEAAEAREPALRQRSAIESIEPVHPLGAYGQAQIPVRSRGALAQDKVRGRAKLAIGEHHRRATQHHLGALDGVVEAKHRGIVEEGQVV